MKLSRNAVKNWLETVLADFTAVCKETKIEIDRLPAGGFKVADNPAGLKSLDKVFNRLFVIVQRAQSRLNKEKNRGDDVGKIIDFKVDLCRVYLDLLKHADTKAKTLLKN